MRDASAVVDPACFKHAVYMAQAEMYTAGEELFALKNTQHPELVKTKKETCLLDQLYGLYMDVVHTLERWGMVIYIRSRHRVSSTNSHLGRITIHLYLQ